jgi:hypothetical protein
MMAHEVSNVCPARHDIVTRALNDAGAFSSAFGVTMNDQVNPVLRGNTAVGKNNGRKS